MTDDLKALWIKIRAGWSWLLAWAATQFGGGTSYPSSSPLGLKPKKEKVVRPPDERLKVVIGDPPRGVRFDPKLHPALLQLQRNAVFEIFDLLGAGWVPGVYWQILLRNPDPGDALREFCDEFRVDAGLLGLLDPTEVARFNQLLGILLELEDLEELGADERAQIFSDLGDGNYASAETLINIAQAVYGLIKDAEALLPRIVFPAYAKFIEDLRTYREHPFQLSADDADGAREVHAQFCRWQDAFDALLERLDAELGWLTTYWPEGTDWAKANEPIMQGLFAAKEAVENALKMDANPTFVDTDPPEEGIEAGLLRLEQIYVDLLAFIEALKAANPGSTWDPPKDTRAADIWGAWCSACKDLGIPPDSDRSAAKSAYRKLALANHPDRHPGDKIKEARFLQASAAWETIDKILRDHGVPTNPATTTGGAP